MLKHINRAFHIRQLYRIIPESSGKIEKITIHRCLDIINMTRDTPIPKQQDKFWASENNKRALQAIARDIILSMSDLTCGVVVDNEAIPAKQQDTDIEGLTNYIEEANCRIISHAEWSVRVQHCNRVVVISSDADNFALYSITLRSSEKREWRNYGRDTD